MSRLEIGLTLRAPGSTDDLWTSLSSVRYRFEFCASDVFGSLSTSGEYGDGGGRNQIASTGFQYYLPTSKRSLFFTSLSLAKIRNPDSNRLLEIGGDNGLRGYPLRYQRGEQRVLLTVEQRAYSDWYPFRLFRVGGAVFVDVGRAWVGEPSDVPAVHRGWLSNIGIGARLLSTRSASGKVFHIDLAFPFHDDPGIDKVQFLFKNRIEF